MLAVKRDNKLCGRLCTATQIFTLLMTRLLSKFIRKTKCVLVISYISSGVLCSLPPLLLDRWNPSSRWATSYLPAFSLDDQSIPRSYLSNVPRFGAYVQTRSNCEGSTMIPSPKVRNAIVDGRGAPCFC